MLTHPRSGERRIVIAPLRRDGARRIETGENHVVNVAPSASGLIRDGVGRAAGEAAEQPVAADGHQPLGCVPAGEPVVVRQTRAMRIMTSNDLVVRGFPDRDEPPDVLRFGVKSSPTIRRGMNQAQ